MKTTKTLESVALLWSSDKRRYVKPATWSTYQLLLHHHILPSLGSLTAVSEEEVQSFVLDRLGAGLSKSTVKEIVTVLKMVVRYGARLGHWGVPDWQIRFPTGSPRKNPSTMPPEQQRRLMDWCRANPSARNAGIMICLSTGMRIGEICALKWEDVDFGERLIHVRRTFSRIYIWNTEGGRGSTSLVAGPPKTPTSTRDIPVSDILGGFLAPLARDASPGDFVLSSGPRAMEPRCYRNHYRRALERAGVPYRKFHSLRHSFATRCIEADCDYKTVSVLLGHSGISTTLNLYVHPDMAHKRECIDKVMGGLC